MTIPRVQVFGPSFQDLAPSAIGDGMVIADIIVVDRSAEAGPSPKVYQVKQDTASAIKDQRLQDATIQSLLSDSYVLLGELWEEKRGHHLLMLRDGREVSYNFMVVISGRLPPSHDPAMFTAGLKGLVEAIKFRRHHITPPSSDSSSNQSQRRPIKLSSQTPQDKSSPQFSELLAACGRETHDAQAFSVAGSDKVFFEVHM